MFDTFLFDEFGSLAGFLTTDIKVVMIAMVTLVFILMGVEILLNLLDQRDCQKEISVENLEHLYDSKRAAKGWQKDMYRKRYNSAINSYIKHNHKNGGC